MAKQIAEMSVEELEKKYKVKAKDGNISFVGGKYYLTVGGEKKELKPDLMISPLPLEHLFAKGPNVRVILSPKDGLPIIFYSTQPPYHIILCYVVAEPWSVMIDNDIRGRLIKKLARENKFPDALANQLISDMAAEARR
jgi:hypothetical protein